MRDAIQSFHTQFSFEPKIENENNFKQCSHFIVAGMGGSHLAGGVLKTRKPELPITIHNDYDIPTILDPTNTLVIASSYSGNTEETITSFEASRKQGIATVAITTGGKLLQLAKEYKTPYIQLPAIGIQPRSALGFSTKAFAYAMGENELLKELTAVEKKLEPQFGEEKGKKLAERFKDHVPVIYASRRNLSIAYNWKIKFNETGKIPAFYNVLPELNHNEMTGFDVKETSLHLSERFYFIIITSRDDHPRVQKRMNILKEQYKSRGLPVVTLALLGQTPFHAIFSALVLADWAAYYTARLYGLESEQVPMVEEFKKMMAG